MAKRRETKKRRGDANCVTRLTQIASRSFLKMEILEAKEKFRIFRSSID